MVEIVSMAEAAKRLEAPRHSQINPALKAATLRAVEALFPVKTENGDLEIRATNLSIDDSKFDADALATWQKARQEGETVSAPVYASLELWRGGKKVQTLSKYEIGQLPLMGAMGTFMVGGNDWYVPAAQTRLKAGAYTREKANGEYETFIPMKGGQMSVWMDPAKGVLKIGIFSSNVSWYAIVKALGATDDEIVTALGGDKRARELLSVNRVDDTRDVTKFFMTVFEHKLNRDLLRAGLLKHDQDLVNTDYAAQVVAIKTWLEGKAIDPFVTKQTLGVAIEHAGVELLLRAAKNILDVQRKDVEPDDRDSPEFKTMHGVEDLIPERITKMGRMLQRKLLLRLGKPDTTLAKGFGSNWLGPAVTGNFGGENAGLTNTAEAANPLAILSEQSKLTVTGAGGIESTHAITMGARLFRPTSVGFVDPVHTPEGSQVGISTHIAGMARKRGDTLVAPFRIVKDGKRTDDKVAFLTLEEAAKAVIGYPDGWDMKGQPLTDLVRANKDGQIVTVSPTEVQYMIPSGAAMFDQTSNMASFLAHTHSNRAMMAGKHLTQALPLVNRELPLAKLTGSDGTDLGEKIAKSFVVRAKAPGKVTEVTKDHITVGGIRHEIFDQYPMQAKVALHHYPVVKVGDIVKEGDLLADSNYSKDGKLALGINLFSAYTPWKNASNFEDAIVISESAAEKMSSEHMHRLDLMLEPGVQVAKKIYLAQYPTKISGDNYAKLDEDGVIKEGSEVKTGEVVIAAVQKQTFDTTDTRASTLSMIHKKLERPYRDCGVVWHELPPGKVYRVVKTAKKIEVHLQTVEPMHIGDKLSMGSAAKGTVAQIIPDDKMPRTEAGRVVEVILNPHGVAGRINPSQTIEQAAGKLVKDGGVDYSYANFDGRDHATEVQAGLKKAGLNHTEKLFDPESGKWIEEPVATGFNYMVKLDHSVRKKFSARGRDGYTLDETPIAGRGRGGQSYDQLTTYALLGHNAHATLSESVGIRGTKNDEFWRAFQAGETPPPPKVPFAYSKLLTYMNAAGVDTQQHGHILHYLPMTDKRVLERSNGAVTKATMVKAKNLAEEKGGLFDKEITGGLKGEHWSHIELNEAIPHPLYEKVVRDITGLKTAEFYGLLGHTRRLDPKTGKISEGGDGLTGEEAFRHLLSFRPDEKIDEFKKKLQTAVGSDRNKYNRAVQYLEGLKESKLDAADAYMTKNVPVVPPKYRGIDELSGGALRVAPSNILYRDVMLTNDALAAGKKDEMPVEHLADARMALYQGVGALVGVNNALTHRDDREDAKGFIDVIKGTENKNGLFQRMVARRRNDFTGRSTIEPDANLGVDEVGIPEDMLWKIYHPVVVRRLSQLGWKPADAMLEVEKRGPAARTALNMEMEQRPVTINRSPSLHRWNVTAHRPTMVSGKEIKISPGIIGPHNADFDGDHQLSVVFIAHPVTLAVGGSPMAARFQSTLPVLADGMAVSIVDLADVPHGAVRGVKTGKNGRIAFFDAAPGMKVLAYDAKTATLTWADVDGWSEHYDREIEVVTLSSGFQIVTDDDPRAVYGLDPATLKEWRGTPAEAVGAVVVPRQIRGVPAFASLEEVQLPLGVRSLSAKAWNIPDSVQLTENLGYLLGAFAGDGWASGTTTRAGDWSPQHASFAGDLDDGVFTAVKAAINEILPGIQPTPHHADKAPGRHGDCDRHTFSSVELSRMLDGWCGHGAAKKHLPGWYLAAPEDFRRALFAGLMDTDGSLSVSMAKGKAQVIGGFTSVNLRLVREVRLLAASLGIRGRISGFKYKGQAKGAPRDKQAWQLAFSTIDLVRWGGAGMRCTRKTEKLVGVTCDAECPAAAKADLVPKPAKLALALANALGETRSSAYVILHKKALTMSRVVARQVVERVGRAKVAAMPLGASWLAIIDNDGVTWDVVESVEKTGIRETGYDLTVPGFETFMSIDGVVLSNTMSVTVPITEAARREAFNLMPSNNLFYDKDRKLAFGLSNDIITGLFMLTKPGASSGKTYATADEAIEAYENNKDGLRMGSLVKIEGQPSQQAVGWLIFSKIVPPRFMAGVSAPIDGPKLKALLENIAKTSPGDFNNIARNISQAGFQAAALSGGASSSINELAIDRTKIKRLLEQMERQIAKGKTIGEKRTLALAAFQEHSPELDRLAVEHLDTVGGAYSTFLKAKPSGKITPDQFRQMLVSPVLVSDVQDQVVPSVIKTGYGGGMTTSDYILTTPGARKGMVAKSLSTALPGFLAKEIAGNMGPVRIGEKDCNTQQGIELALVSDMRDHDADLLDRHLLHDIPGTTFKRNDSVTPRMLADLRDRKAQMIWVRSPMTCESTSPPCQMCAGRAPNGELHPVGSNIGLNYGQAVSEPSTQLTLKIFHSGGTIGSGDKLRDGFARLRELLGVPGTIRDQGVLADITGDVTGVRPAPQGGQYVSLRASDGHEVEQHVLAGRALKVKKGDRVEAGQPLSDGNYLPQEIAAKRGLLHAQQYVVDEARKAYASAGVTVRKPVLEVLAAGMMRYMEVTDDGHEKGVTIGDVLPENEFKKLQRENPRIMGKPAIPGVSFKPLLSKDLMERLNFQRLEGSMMEVPAMAGKSDLRGGSSPIPGIAYGAIFRPGQAAFELDSGFAGKH